MPACGPASPSSGGGGSSPSTSTPAAVTIRTALTARGSVADFGHEKQEEVKAAFASSIGVRVTSVSVRVSAAPSSKLDSKRASKKESRLESRLLSESQVTLTFTVLADAEAEATIEEAVRTKLGTADLATASLNVEVEAPPTISSEPGRASDAEGLEQAEADEGLLSSIRAQIASLIECFPSDATVTSPSGATLRLDELKAGDKVRASDASGALYYDEVSRFSYADYGKEAAFVTLATAKKTLTLTAEHRVPVGAECCFALKQAKDVAVGETLWLAGDQTAAPAVVTKVGATVAVGVHNPLMKHGGFPVVDGVVTAFESIAVVKFASATVPIAEALCEATGTCALVHEAVALANGLGPRPFIGGVVGGSGLGLLVATGLAAAAIGGGVRRMASSK